MQYLHPAQKRRRSGYGRVVFPCHALPLLHRSSCFANVDFSAFTGKRLNRIELNDWIVIHNYLRFWDGITALYWRLVDRKYILRIGLPRFATPPNTKNIFFQLAVNIYIFSVDGRVEFLKSCNLIGSGNGRNFPFFPLTIRFHPLWNPWKTWSELILLQRNETVDFFVLKWNFSLTNRWKVKRKISNGIKGLVILRKRRVYLCFCWQNLAGLLLSSCSFLIYIPFYLTRLNCTLVFRPPFSRLKFRYFPWRSLF